MRASLNVPINVLAYVGKAVTLSRTAELQMEQACTRLLQCI
jgi:hypothetical protein